MGMIAEKKRGGGEGGNFTPILKLWCIIIFYYYSYNYDGDGWMFVLSLNLGFLCRAEEEHVWMKNEQRKELDLSYKLIHISQKWPKLQGALKRVKEES